MRKLYKVKYWNLWMLGHHCETIKICRFLTSWQQEQQQMTLFQLHVEMLLMIQRLLVISMLMSVFNLDLLSGFYYVTSEHLRKPCPKISDMWRNAVMIVHGCVCIHKTLPRLITNSVTEKFCICGYLFPIDRMSASDPCSKIQNVCFKMSKNNNNFVLFPDALTVCDMFPSVFKPREICLSFESR